MSDAVFLFRPLSDLATLSGGNWISNGDVSLANVRNDRYWSIARSASPLAADAHIRVDMRRAVDVRGFALALPNITTAAEVTVTAFADAGYTVPTFTTGSITGGESGDQWKDDERAPIISAAFAEPVTARYWLVEIDDPLNLSGAVEVARLFLAEGLSPSFNYGYGATLTFRNNTLSSNTLSGGSMHWRRVNPRQWQCSFNYLPDTEAFGSVYDFLRHVGFDREVFIIPEPGDTSHAQARRFFASITQLDALSQVVFGRSNFGFGVEERVAYAARRSDFSTLPFDRFKIEDFAPLIVTSAEVTLPADSLVLRDYAMSIATGGGLAVPVAAMIQTDFAPMFSGGVVVSMPAESQIIADFAPMVGIGQIISVPATESVQSDYPPLIASGVYSLIPAEVVYQADFAPTLAGGYVANTPVDETVIRSLAPSVSSGGGVVSPTSTQKVRIYAPQVSSGVQMHVPASLMSHADFEPLFGGGVFVLIADEDLVRMRDNAPSIAGGARLLIPSEQSVMRDFATQRHRGFDSGYDAGFN